MSVSKQKFYWRALLGSIHIRAYARQSWVDGKLSYNTAEPKVFPYPIQSSGAGNVLQNCSKLMQGVRASVSPRQSVTGCRLSSWIGAQTWARQFPVDEGNSNEGTWLCALRSLALFSTVSSTVHCLHHFDPFAPCAQFVSSGNSFSRILAGLIWRNLQQKDY